MYYPHKAVVALGDLMRELRPDCKHCIQLKGDVRIVAKPTSWPISRISRNFLAQLMLHQWMDSGRKKEDKHYAIVHYEDGHYQTRTAP